QRELQDKQSRLEDAEHQLADARQATEAAQSEAAQAKDQNNALQSKLDEEISQIDKIKHELEQVKAAQSSTNNTEAAPAQSSAPRAEGPSPEPGLQSNPEH